MAAQPTAVMIAVRLVNQVEPKSSSSSGWKLSPVLGGVKIKMWRAGEHGS